MTNAWSWKLLTSLDYLMLIKYEFSGIHRDVIISIICTQTYCINTLKLLDKFQIVFFC